MDTIRFKVTLEDVVPPNQLPNIVMVEAYIIVLDENDNSPQFIGTPYETTVSENILPGTTLFREIFVTDPDFVGQNIIVTCVSQAQVCEKIFYLVSIFYQHSVIFDS